MRYIVAAHGGTVHAESPGPRKGSVFTIKLPLMLIARTADEAERRDRTAAATTLAQQPALDGLRVLVVDDEADANESLLALLSSCGAEVRVAASVAQALNVFGRLGARSSSKRRRDAG